MKILLVGFPKTGNTWTRFVIFNYWNILENSATNTLSYQELIDIDKAIWKESEQYPPVYFSHIPVNGKMLLGTHKGIRTQIYKKVNKIIYVIRNPFDTMISYFYYLTNRDHPFNERFEGKELEILLSLEGFVKKMLPLYINHVKSTMGKANVVVKYEIMREDPIRFINVLKLVFGKINLKIAQEAIWMSSFDNIKQMGINTGRTGGLASSFRDHFTRNGTVG